MNRGPVDFHAREAFAVRNTQNQRGLTTCEPLSPTQECAE